MSALPWKSIWDNAPLDREFLLCVPGVGDHFYVVEWFEDPSFARGGYWAYDGGGVTVETLESCHLLPMYLDFDTAPSSICFDAIQNTHANAYK